MDNKVLIGLVVARLKRWGFLVLLVAALWGGAGYLFSKMLPPQYSSYALLFSVNASQNTGGTLESILSGGSNNGSGFSTAEAAVNILDLAQSKTTSQAVALTRLPNFGNKTIGELLIEEANKQMLPWQQKYERPKTESDIRITGGDLAKSKLVPRLSKTGSLELKFNHTDPALLYSLSYDYIEKISQYYINLKVTKANADYDFMLRKLDTINRSIKNVDQRIVDLNRQMLFVPRERMDLVLPMKSLETDKARLTAMRAMALNNLEEALWRKQKATPIMKILDPPDPPYYPVMPGSKMYVLLGFIAGLFLGILLLNFDLIYKFIIAAANAKPEEVESLSSTNVVTATEAP